MAFIEDFRKIVCPRLISMARFHAVLIATGDEGFAAALDCIQHEASRLGAVHLPSVLFDDLFDEAIPGWLIENINSVLLEWDTARALYAKVAIDIARHDQKWLVKEVHT